MTFILSFIYIYISSILLKIHIGINSFSIFFADDCPNCVDEHGGSLAASRWTMPLLKLGEKRYYLGIFFKVSFLPVTLIYLTGPSTLPGLGLGLYQIISELVTFRLCRHERFYGASNAEDRSKGFSG